MKFNFKAKDKNGEVKEGVIVAVSNEAAVAILQRNELYPISLKVEQERSELIRTLLKYYDRVSDKELIVFFRQLSILIEARVPIVSSIAAINDQITNKFFSKVLSEMISDIEDGLPFSSALEKHADVFSPLSINLIKAGETSGNLKGSIEYVAENIDRNYTLSARIKTAMTYPAIVMCVFFIIGFLMISFVIPKLTLIIKEMGAEVPWYTNVVIVVGDFMANFWWLVALIIMGIVAGVMYYLNTPDGKKEFDQIKIRIPIIGKLFQYIYVSRFSQNLAVLLAGGIPIIRALTIVSTVINNSLYEKLIMKTAETVKMGGNISDELKKSPLFPSVVSHMIKIGEETGRMDIVLTHVAKFYDQETDIITKNLSSVIEPVLMVIIGIAVGVLAFAILMPIYNIANQIQ